MMVKTTVAQVVGFNFLDIVARSQTHGEISLLQQTNVRYDKSLTKTLIIMNMSKDLQEKMERMREQRISSMK